MSLSLVLSPTSEKKYKPGSLVQGTVFLTTRNSISIGSIKVAFRGLSRVTLTQNYGDLNVSNTDYHSCAVLFQIERPLYAGGKWTHQAGHYSWDFEFQIPTSVERSSGVGSRCPYLSNQDDWWTADASRKAQPLPSSMLYSCRGFTCSVEYVLEATLAPPTGRAMPKSLVSKGMLNVHSDALVDSDINEPGILTHVRFDEVLRSYPWHRKYSMHKPFARLFKASSASRDGHAEEPPTPPSSLKISVLLPKMIEVKSEYSTIDIFFSAHSGGVPNSCSASSSNPIPCITQPVVMNTMRIAIIQFTRVRAGHHTSTSTRKTYTRKTTCSLPLQVSPSTDSQDFDPVEREEVVNLGKVTELRIAKEFLLADFATSNISVEHALDLEIGLEFDGRRVDVVRKDVPIRVINAPARNTTQSAQIGHREGMAAQSFNHQDQSQFRFDGRDLQGSWVSPPREERDVSEQETDACLSQPPPRYMLRAQ